MKREIETLRRVKVRVSVGYSPDIAAARGGGRQGVVCWPAAGHPM